MSERHIQLDNTHLGKRLDKVLAETLPDMSRSRLKALIEQGAIVDDATGLPITDAARPLRATLSLTLIIPEAEEAEPKAQDIPLEVVYEDSDLIVVNKAPDMVVHPAPGNPDSTLVNALLHHCRGSLSGIGGVKRPGIVHRIDKETSGLLVMAKNDATHAALSQQFSDHTVQRQYWAVVRGLPQPLGGRIEGNIGRNPNNRKKMAQVKNGGKHAVTHYRTLVSFHGGNGSAVAALVACQLETGRTHQVRVHMASIGHPLIGDPLYGHSGRLGNSVAQPIRTLVAGFHRQALHARTLGFLHPDGRRLAFDAPAPADIQLLLGELGRITDVAWHVPEGDNPEVCKIISS